MKKVITITLCIISLVFLSCTSTPETKDANNETTAPSTSEKTEESKEEPVTEKKEVIEEKIESEEIEEALNNELTPLIDDKVKEEETTLPPLDIIEPDIITVTPSEVEEYQKENEKLEENEDKKDNNLEELVIIDALPPIPITEEEAFDTLKENEKNDRLPLELTEEDLSLENLENIEEKEVLDDNGEFTSPAPSITEKEDAKTPTLEPSTDKKESVKTESDTITKPSSTPSEESGFKDEEELVKDEEENIEEEIVIEEEKDEGGIKPSRSVTVKRREYINVSYPGTGWIYMGAIDNSKDITYFGRDLGSKDTNFSLQAKNAGTKILHFYKNDLLTGEYIDDYVEVIVLDEIGSNKTHIAAPPYLQPTPKKSEEMFYEQKTVTEENDKEVSSVSLTTEKENDYNYSSESFDTYDTEEDGVILIGDEDDEVIEIVEDEEDVSFSNIDTETLLKEAELLYNEKEYSAALEKINEFLELATKHMDKGLYLKGQILEAKSDIQNIKGAINAYSTLTKDFPASMYWNEANKRIVYLKRFYLEVR